MIIQRPGLLGRKLLMVAMTPLAIILAAFSIRFIRGGDNLRGGNFLNRIGHLALEPDMLIKSSKLGWHPRYHWILLVTRDRPVNPALLDYWSKYIKVIKNPLFVKLLRPLEDAPVLGYDTSWVRLPGGKKERLIPAAYKVQATYDAEHGGGSLLTLSSTDRERGWQALHSLGVPRGAWFACLHVRESGYLPELSYHSFRDAQIDSYRLAVQAIVDRGGWVIRIGDESMEPLGPMDRVIDATHGDISSDWMDVFSLSQCRFLLGTTSGPMCVALAFGVPCCMANFIPMGHGPYSSRDIWIPKLYWSDNDDRYLSFAEVLLTPMRRIFRTDQYQAAGIKPVDNSPEEIKDLAVEMMDRLVGDLQHTGEDDALQERFKTLLDAEPLYATGARMGRDFLRKHVSLFDAPPSPARLSTMEETAEEAARPLV